MVQTDYGTSDRLYFEPLTLEDVLNVVREERPNVAILQFGGRTPLTLARMLELEGLSILGTTPEFSKFTGASPAQSLQSMHPTRTLVS